LLTMQLKYEAAWLTIRPTCEAALLTTEPPTLLTWLFKVCHI
jgi:hypothetical protein